MISPGFRRKTNIRKRVSPVLLILAAILLPHLIPDLRAAAADPSAAAADVIELDIGIRPSAYQKLFSAPETEPAVPVQVSADGGALVSGEFKIRGGSSKMIGLMTPGKRFSFELKPDQSDLFAETLNNSCVKLINAWTPSRLLGEYLAMELYDFMEIPSPAHALTFLQFNGVDFGLYLASENVNAEFLRKIDPDGGGSLFKAKGYSYDASCWFGFLRLVEDRGLERADALIDALTRGAGYEQYLDVDEVLRYFACIAVWGAEDTILTERKPSNFFLYDTGERFIVIPWDSSEAFTAYDSETGIDSFWLDEEGKEDKPALFSLLMENETYKKTYHDYIRKINESFLAPDLIDARFDALGAAAKPYLERDYTIICNRVEDFLTVHPLLAALHEVHNSLSAQLNGEADRFFISSELLSETEENAGGGDEESAAADEEEAVIGSLASLIRNSPHLDPDIAEKIRAAYPAWRRAHGQLPCDADDPIEIAVAAGFFLSVFLLLLILMRKKSSKKTAVDS